MWELGPVPGSFFAPKLVPTYTGILDWLKKANLKDFPCQNDQVPLFSTEREQWSVKNARGFVKVL